MTSLHPRWVRWLARFFGSEPGGPHIYLTEPLGYLEFLNLNIHAQLVLTDSGGLQEETTILGVPCVTLRDNTERPITITQGTNRLGGTSKRSILAAVEAALDQPPAGVRCPEKWDGKASERIAEIIAAAHGAKPLLTTAP